jgi:hypothetical protein
MVGECEVVVKLSHSFCNSPSFNASNTDWRIGLRALTAFNAVIGFILVLLMVFSFLSCRAGQ